VHLGTMHAASYAKDPKHLAFVLARYANTARILEGAGNVLEIGCGDGTGAPIVRQVVGHLYGIDIEDQLLPQAQFAKHDITSSPFYCHDQGYWDAAFALDVLEHINPGMDEHWFFLNIIKTLKPYATLVIGMPSLESQEYASEQSVKYHVNCKTEDGLRATLQRYFHCVYLFGMNDMTLHTGFGHFCHYRLAIAAAPR
jgi:predicted TPR repeat methyltransferase